MSILNVTLRSIEKSQENLVVVSTRMLPSVRNFGIGGMGSVARCGGDDGRGGGGGR
jgi:hypothetical protein